MTEQPSRKSKQVLLLIFALKRTGSVDIVRCWTLAPRVNASFGYLPEVDSLGNF